MQKDVNQLVDKSLIKISVFLCPPKSLIDFLNTNHFLQDQHLPLGVV